MHFSSADKHQRMRGLLEDVCRLARGRECALFETVPEMGVAVLAAATDEVPPLQIDLSRIDPDGLVARVLRERRPVLVPEILDPGSRLAIDEVLAPAINCRTLLALPVPDRGAAIGFLLVGRDPMGEESPSAEVLAPTLRALGQALFYRREAARYRDRVVILEARQAAWQEKYRVLFDHAGDGVLVTDRRGQILEANAAFRTLTGYTEADLAALTLPEIETQTAAGGEEVFLGPGEGRHRIRCQGGTERELAYRRELMRQDGREYLLHVERPVEGARAPGPGTDPEVCARGVVHDMNNVVQSIRAHAQDVLDHLGTGHPQASALGEILAATRRMEGLVQALGRGGLPDVPGPAGTIDVGDVVHDVMEFIRGSLAPEISLVGHKVTGLPRVRMNAEDLSRCLCSLCLAVADALGDGGTLTLHTSALHEADPDRAGTALPDFVRIAVVGSGGAGGSFGPAADAETTSWLETLGRPVREAGGRIGALKTPGPGLAFEILLPAAAGRARAPAEPAARGKFAGTAPRGGKPALRALAFAGRPGTVLVVDDEPTMNELAQRVLSEIGVTVLTARSGAEALEILGQQAQEIDAVILDLFMPGMSGAEVYGRIKAIRPDLPVLMTSGFQSDDLPPEILREESTRFLHKPYEVGELIERVAEMLPRTPKRPA